MYQLCNVCSTVDELSVIFGAFAEGVGKESRDSRTIDLGELWEGAEMFLVLWLLLDLCLMQIV